MRARFLKLGMHLDYLNKFCIDRSLEKPRFTVASVAQYVKRRSADQAVPLEVIIVSNVNVIFYVWVFTNKQKINFPWLNETSARWHYFVYARTWGFAE